MSRIPTPREAAGRTDEEPEKRRAILHAAVRVFAEKGYQGCRIADVARAAHVAYGLVYHYFRNKDELLESVFAEQWAILINAIRAVDEGPGTAAESGPGVDNLGWSVIGGVIVSWPFFQGGLTKASVKEAEYNAASIDAQTEALRQSVRVELQNALLAVRGAKSEIEAADEALVNARERLRLAEGRYQTGVGSIIELGDAQVALTQAAAQKVQADFDLATARGQLLHALGNDV